MTTAVTRARKLRWLRLDSSGKGGSNQSAAAEAGLRQGSAGCQGTAAEGLLAQGTAALGASGHEGGGGGKNEGCVGQPPPPPPPPPCLNRHPTAAEGSFCAFSLLPANLALLAFLWFQKM